MTWGNAILILSVLATPPAYSLEAGSSEAAGTLEEIVVTAQRREEKIQNVPISVMAITANGLQEQGAIDTTALNALVPSLNVTQNGPENVFFLRGLGSPVAAVNGESSVAMYVDGVYMYSPFGNNFLLGSDIDRVEVLNGPQGTLFGRNATAGVIQIITKDPQQDPGASVSLGYGNFQTGTAEVYATTGITPTLAADVSVYEKGMGQGYGINTFNGTQTYENHEFMVRTKWLWTPDDATEVRAAFSYNKITGSIDNFQIMPGHIQLDGKLSTATPYNTQNDWPDLWTGEIYTYSLQADHDFSFGRLEDIVSYRDIPTSAFIFDDDVTSSPLINTADNSPSNVVTEELRLLSPKGSRFQWVAGVYYIRANTEYNPIDLSGTAVAPPPTHIYEYDLQRLWAIAPYGQATVEVFNDTNFTAGVRYNSEHLETPGTQVESPPGNVLVPGVSESQADHNTSWRVALDHKWTPDIMSYISNTRSYKSGGYNLAAQPGTSLPPFLPEQVTSTEIGTKSEFFEHRLLLNGAAYYYQYIDIQVNHSTPGGEITTNGPSALFTGAEANFVAAIADGVKFSGAVNYVDGHYGNFPNAIEFPQNLFLGPSLFNATNKTTVYTPKWSANLGFDYKVYLPVGEFAFNANAAYSAQVYAAVSNRLVIPSYTIENNTLTWTPPQSRYSVKLWVLNTFNREYISNRLETGTGDWQNWAPPRTYGVSFTARFGSSNKQ